MGRFSFAIGRFPCHKSAETSRQRSSRASSPSEMTSRLLYVKSVGIVALYVCSCLKAVRTVAFSSAAFFSSMTTSGKLLTNSTTSGRLLMPFSMTVNWLTARNSLLAGSSKSTSQTRSPRSWPSLWTVTGMPSVSRRWNASLLAMRSGAVRRWIWRAGRPGGLAAGHVD